MNDKNNYHTSRRETPRDSNYGGSRDARDSNYGGSKGSRGSSYGGSKEAREGKDFRKKSKNYKQKSAYEMNFFCFDIKDFQNMDSITVYDPETKGKIRGIVTGTDSTSRDITYNTFNANGLKTNINNILFLKEYDKSWLA